MTIVHQVILKIMYNFLILGDGPTYHINDGVGETEKKRFNIDFTKAKTNLCLSLYYNGAESYLYVNKLEFSI